MKPDTPNTPDDVSKHEAVLLMVQGIIEQLHRSPGLGNGPFSLDGWKIIRDALETPRSESERTLLANVIEHWEHVPNDIKSDPGMHNLNSAMRAADKALGGTTK